MPALNFQEKFAAAVSSGRKTQTIRALRKRPIRVGDTVYLYTGQRTKAAQRLGTGTVIEVHDIMFCDRRPPAIVIDGKRVAYAGLESEEIAVRDGFVNIRALLHWFRKTHGLPFRGHLIRWRLT